MLITNTMDTEDLRYNLASTLSAKPDELAGPAIEKFRAALNENAPTYGWKTTSDVEDTDWFRMWSEASA